MKNEWTERIEELEAENARLARDNKVCVELNDKLVAEIARIEDRVSEEYEAERTDDRAKIEELKKENKRLREQYNSLIFEVSYKFPGESRHDTAKRYIREREEHGIEIVAKQALKEASHEP